MAKEFSWQPGRILLPVSYTSYELNAVYIAFYISECSGSAITVYHVRASDEKLEPAILDDIREFASRLKVKYEVKEKILEGRFSHKAVASCIIEEANKKEYDCIVMSAHREAFYLEFFGRVADRVVKNVNKKIILVESPKEGLKIPLNPKRILVATFTSKVSKDMVSLATLLTSSATTTDAEISVARIVELPPTVPLDIVVESKDFKQAQKTFSHDIGSYIKLLGRPLNPIVLPIREPYDAIRYFKERNIDIVLLSVTRPKIVRSLLSKREYGIIKNSPFVTLVVIPSQQETVATEYSRKSENYIDSPKLFANS
ncbi:MAG: universal stress protein [Nitrososphaeria archaeon]